jgi:Tol biopolymer transport system component
MWGILAIIALGLSAATAYLYIENRRLSSTAGAAYRLAYTSIQEEAQAKLSGQLLSCDLRGRNVMQLTDTDVLDGFAACEPLPSGTGTEPRLAFLRLQIETQPDSGASDSGVGMPGAVYVVNARGKGLKKVSGGLERVWTVAPSWSPDGKQVVFASVEDLNNDGQLLIDEVGIYVCNVKDAQWRRIASINGAIVHLSWSPASPQILVTFIESNVLVSTLLDAETGRSILEGPAPAASWSPDGLELAAYLTEDDKIHILRPDGSESYELDPPPGQVSQLLWVPTWPASKQVDQGRLLAISAPEHTSEVGQLYVRSAEPDGQRWERLVSPDDQVIHIAASPDGRYVTYTLFTGGPADASQPVPPADVYLLEIGHNQPVRLTADPGFEGLATWIPVQ